MRGRTVVVDAVNESGAARDTWRRASTHTGADLVFILLTLEDQAEHRRRLEGRVRTFANIDEPSWDEVLDRASAFEAWVGDCTTVTASGAIAEVARACHAVVTAART